MARARTATQMARLVAQWRASGEPQARFARRHGVRPWTLWYWSRKTTSPSAATPTFVPVVTPAVTPATIAIELPGDVRVVLPSEMAPATVAALVTALRAAC